MSTIMQGVGEGLLISAGIAVLFFVSAFLVATWVNYYQKYRMYKPTTVNLIQKSASSEETR